MRRPIAQFRRSRRPRRPSRWPIATRRSTSTTRCRSRTTPTSRSGRNGSTTPISFSSRCLPPKAVDTAEELAQLSQYVINIVDFRDPDCTMTHWVNPDVVIAGVPVDAGRPWATRSRCRPTAVTLVLAGTIPAPANPVQLDQYGMEYNPVAINEVLAYSFNYVPTGTGLPQRGNRFFAELVNTQTSPELRSRRRRRCLRPAFNPVLDLGGFEYIAGDPYSGGSWDIVFTADDPYSRPDPYRGQLCRLRNLLCGHAAYAVQLQAARRGTHDQQPGRYRHGDRRIRRDAAAPGTGRRSRLRPWPRARRSCPPTTSTRSATARRAPRWRG